MAAACRYFAVVLGLWVVLQTAGSGLCAGDLYMTPDGSGGRTGLGWDDALSYRASATALQDAWSRLEAGGTLHLGVGEYEAQSFLLTSDGASAAERRTLRGEVRDGQCPVFVGEWGRHDKNKGFSFIQIASGARWWALENLRIRRVRTGVEVQSPGRVAHGVVANVHLEEVRDGFVFIGGATAIEPEVGTHDLVVSDCSVTNYTKRGFRLRDGCHDVRFERCVADAGGKEWATEAFQMSFNVMGGKGGAGVFDHDITFVDCIARNNYWDAGEGYWNADGFCAEGGAKNLVYIGCVSLDNTDGGWDDKSANPLLIGCVSMRNKKNYRFWSSDPGATLIRCVGAYALKRGGNSGPNGIWTRGRIRALKSSFVENGTSLMFDDWKVTPEIVANMSAEMRDCIITLTEEQQAALAGFSGASFPESVIWRPGGQTGEAVGYAASEDARALMAAGEAFDSVQHGEAKGYHSSWRSEDWQTKGRELQPRIEIAGRLLPAETIKVYAGKRPDGWYVSGWNGAEMRDSEVEGKTVLEVVSSAKGGGATYRTKSAGDDISFGDRESADWQLHLSVKAAGKLSGDLKMAIVSLDESEKSKEIPLPLRAGAEDWQDLVMPIKLFSQAPDKSFARYAGFYIRCSSEVDRLYIRRVELKPAP